MRAIDCLVNVDLGDAVPPEWLVRVKEDTFKGGESFLRSRELAEILDDMDANGVERAILMTQLADLIGVERILFGSDWPHGEGVAQPMDFAKELSAFDENEVRRIMRENCLELLGA